MAGPGPGELGSFITKFVILWQSGCEAKLQVESAFVTLRVGLGQAQPGHHHHGVVHHQGGVVHIIQRYS